MIVVHGLVVSYFTAFVFGLGLALGFGGGGGKASERARVVRAQQVTPPARFSTDVRV